MRRGKHRRDKNHGKNGWVGGNPRWGKHHGNWRGERCRLPSPQEEEDDVKTLTTQLTSADLAALNAATAQRLAEMACILNLWHWPNDLPNPEEPDRRPVGKGWSSDNRRGAFRHEIERRIGAGAINQEWNRRTGKNGRGHRKWTQPLPMEFNYTFQGQRAS